ncbi:MAG: hypothetical protein RLZ88_1020 [Actinomycetota bacterium]
MFNIFAISNIYRLDIGGLKRVSNFGYLPRGILAHQPRISLVRQDRKRVVIAPITVDVNVAALGSLIPKPKLLHDAKRGSILGTNIDLHSVQTNYCKQVIGCQGHRGRRHSPARKLRRNPVAEHRTRNRAIQNVRDIQLTRHLTINLDDERKPLPRSGLAKQTLDHRLDVEVNRPIGIGGLPWSQPGAIAQDETSKFAVIAAAQRPHPDIAVNKFEARHAGKISRMLDSELANAKQSLRKELQARRANLGFAPEPAEGIMRNLAELCSARGSRRVACYLSFGSEPDTELFIDWAMDAGLEVLLPVANTDGTLHWVVFEGETETGIFGFAEPVGAVTDLSGVDLVIAPALAVDQLGNRLGKGKGYYDRALADDDIPVVAVVYDDELLESIPVEAHDRPVHAVVTPSQLVIF